MFRTRDTVLLSGWLFADLLLALAVLFLATNNAALNPPLLPTLIVTPTILDANTPSCSGGSLAPRCTVMVKEANASQGTIIWTVSSDISDSIHYSINSGTLSPGQAVPVTISAIPCQNGSFTFSAVRQSDKTHTTPIIVSWHCTPPKTKPERLDLRYQRFMLTVNDVGAFLNGTSEDSDIKQQIRSKAILRGRSVGIAIVYGGAPTTDNIAQAQQVANKVYSILTSLGQEGFVFQRAVNYEPLYTLRNPQSEVDVDVFFFTS